MASEEVEFTFLPPVRRQDAAAPSTKAKTFRLFPTLLLVLLLAVSSFASPTPGASLAGRPSKLSRPVVLLVSCDGFRFGYQFKTPTPNIRRLIAGGTQAEEGLIPVFPTATFPNHYVIVTGLYPAYHGIIYNYFTDPETGDKFTVANHDPKWWLGEPLWQTATSQGQKVATHYWPGSEIVKGSWTCPPEFCPKYNGSVPFEERVDTVLGYFDLPKDEIPSFIALYFPDPARIHKATRSAPTTRRSPRRSLEWTR